MGQISVAGLSRQMRMFDTEQRHRSEARCRFGYLLRLAEVLNVDLREALDAIIKINAWRYPADRDRAEAPLSSRSLEISYHARRR